MRNMNQDMPRERLLTNGAEALSDSELVAILLRTGTRGTDVMTLSRSLLSRFGSILGLLAADVDELARVKGIGIAKAVALKASLEIGHRVFRELANVTGATLKEPDSVYYMCSDMTLMKNETVRVISLDTKLNYCGMTTVSVGTLDTSVVHPREVYRYAISKSAAAVILVHNHPSGDPKPSAADDAVTRKITDAGEALGIKLVDHVIIGRGRFYSYAARKQFLVEVNHGLSRRSSGDGEERAETEESCEACLSD